MTFGVSAYSARAYSSLTRRTFLSAAAGAFVFSGQAVRFLYNRAVKAAKGTFTVSGQSVRFLYNRAVKAANGVFLFTGQTATRLRYARIFHAGAGIFIVGGMSAILRFIRRSLRVITVVAENRALSVSATPASKVSAEDRRVVVGAEERSIVVHKDKDAL